MIPYGKSSKLRINLPDNHPQKGYVNWWENDFGDIKKGAARQKAKRQINKELNENYQGN